MADLELVTAEGPWGGPVYRCRSAEIRCLEGGFARGLVMEGLPLRDNRAALDT